MATASIDELLARLFNSRLVDFQRTINQSAFNLQDQFYNVLSALRVPLSPVQSSVNLAGTALTSVIEVDSSVWHGRVRAVFSGVGFSLDPNDSNYSVNGLSLSFLDSPGASTLTSLNGTVDVGLHLDVVDGWLQRFAFSSFEVANDTFAIRLNSGGDVALSGFAELLSKEEQDFVSALETALSVLNSPGSYIQSETVAQNGTTITRVIGHTQARTLARFQ